MINILNIFYRLKDHRKWHAVGLKIIDGPFNGRYIM